MNRGTVRGLRQPDRSAVGLGTFPREVPKSRYRVLVPFEFPSSSGSSTAFTPTLNQLVMLPVSHAHDTTYDQLTAKIETGAAGSSFRYGLYADTGFDAPGVLIAELGSVATTASFAYSTLAMNGLFPAGLVWLGWVAQSSGSAAQPKGITPNAMQHLRVSDSSTSAINGQVFGGYAVTGVSGGLPADVTTTAVAQYVQGSAGWIPYLLGRVAA